MFSISLKRESELFLLVYGLVDLWPFLFCGSILFIQLWIQGIHLPGCGFHLIHVYEIPFWFDGCKQSIWYGNLLLTFYITLHFLESNFVDDIYFNKYLIKVIGDSYRFWDEKVFTMVQVFNEIWYSHRFRAPKSMRNL